MARGRLTDRQIRQANTPGVLIDGDGLRLKIQADRTGGVRKNWVLRVKVAGAREREIGLGRFGEVSLAQARERAEDLRRQARQGVDPLLARDAARQGPPATEIEPSFKECAERYLAAHEPAWRNPKHRQQWRNTLVAYAYPVLGDKPARDIDQADVLAVLEPIWSTKTETASRLRGRIEAVLDWAAVRGYRGADNPARWRGRLQRALPARRKVRRVEHHPFLPYADLPGFWAELAMRSGAGADCLRFLILTGARNSEARLATWDEVDFDARIWTVPASRMKAGVEHRVPLAPSAIALLQARRSLPGGSDLVFESDTRAGRPLSDATLGAVLKRMKRDVVPHGFRSAFRVWAAECTSYAYEACELALAHKVGGQVQRAYLRTDLIDERRRLMEDWAAFVMGGSLERTTATEVA